MQRSVTRIRTSHVGRLPPPKGPRAGRTCRGGVVNLAARGMLVVSVARRLGSEGPLPTYFAARSNRAGPEKGALRES
jgi:hypothetical protein